MKYIKNTIFLFVCLLFLLITGCTTMYLPQAFGSEDMYVVPRSLEEIEEDGSDISFQGEIETRSAGSALFVDTPFTHYTGQLAITAAQGFIMTDDNSFNLAISPGVCFGTMVLADEYKDDPVNDGVPNDFIYAVSASGQIDLSFTFNSDFYLFTPGVSYGVSNELFGNYKKIRKELYDKYLSESEDVDDDYVLFEQNIVNAGSSGLSSTGTIYFDISQQLDDEGLHFIFRPFIGSSLPDSFFPAYLAWDSEDSTYRTIGFQFFGLYLGVREGDRAYYIKSKIDELASYTVTLGVSL